MMQNRLVNRTATRTGYPGTRYSVSSERNSSLPRLSCQPARPEEHRRIPPYPGTSRRLMPVTQYHYK
eukprot:1914871-Rhodomonas_salina.1